MSEVIYQGDGFNQRVAVREMASALKAAAASLEMAAHSNSKNLHIIDWEALREGMDADFDHLFTVLGLNTDTEDDGELDMIEGEEDVDEDWFEGYVVDDEA